MASAPSRVDGFLIFGGTGLVSSLAGFGWMSSLLIATLVLALAWLALLYVDLHKSAAVSRSSDTYETFSSSFEEENTDQWMKELRQSLEDLTRRIDEETQASEELKEKPGRAFRSVSTKSPKGTPFRRAQFKPNPIIEVVRLGGRRWAIHADGKKNPFSGEAFWSSEDDGNEDQADFDAKADNP